MKKKCLVDKGCNYVFERCFGSDVGYYRNAIFDDKEYWNSNFISDLTPITAFILDDESLFSEFCFYDSVAKHDFSVSFSKFEEICAVEDVSDSYSSSYHKVGENILQVCVDRQYMFSVRYDKKDPITAIAQGIAGAFMLYTMGIYFSGTGFAMGSEYLGKWCTYGVVKSSNYLIKPGEKSEIRNLLVYNLETGKLKSQIVSLPEFASKFSLDNTNFLFKIHKLFMIFSQVLEESIRESIRKNS